MYALDAIRNRVLRLAKAAEGATDPRAKAGLTLQLALARELEARLETVRDCQEGLRAPLLDVAHCRNP